MPYCTECGTKYSNAKFCNNCGAAFSDLDSNTSNNNITVQNFASINNEKPSHSVRKGMVNAKFNEEASNFLFGQIGVLAIFIGIYLSSWIAFGGVLLGLIIAMQINELAVIFCVLLSAGAGYVGFRIGIAFESTSAGIVIALLLFLSSLGYNLAGLKWANDIGD